MPAPTVVEFLSRHRRLVEVGVGARADVAATLADRGHPVTATDIRSVETPPSVRFVIDDITTPETAVYTDAGALYARRLPAELQQPLTTVAAQVGAAAYFTTLGGELPAVETTTHTLLETTIYQSAGPSAPTDTTVYELR